MTVSRAVYAVINRGTQRDAARIGNRAGTTGSNGAAQAGVQHPYRPLTCPIWPHGHRQRSPRALTTVSESPAASLLVSSAQVNSLPMSLRIPSNPPVDVHDCYTSILLQTAATIAPTCNAQGRAGRCLQPAWPVDVLWREGGHGPGYRLELQPRYAGYQQQPQRAEPGVYGCDRGVVSPRDDH